MPVCKVAAYVDSKNNFISSVYVSYNTISDIQKSSQKEINSMRSGPLLVASNDQVEALDLYITYIGSQNIDNLYFPDGMPRPKYMNVKVGLSVGGNSKIYGVRYCVGTVMYTPDMAVFFIQKISSGKSRLIYLKSTAVSGALGLCNNARKKIKI